MKKLLYAPLLLLIVSCGTTLPRITQPRIETFDITPGQSFTVNCTDKLVLDPDTDKWTSRQDAIDQAGDWGGFGAAIFDEVLKLCTGNSEFSQNSPATRVIWEGEMNGGYYCKLNNGVTKQKGSGPCTDFLGVCTHEDGYEVNCSDCNKYGNCR